MEHRRPDPDELLARVQEVETRKAQGKLKIFFGAAPGVGKTYAMLEAARARRAEGLDVVVGWVETHGRKETEALLEGLEVMPRRQLSYRGTRLADFDLEAALDRRPSLILVDELAHTNAPGSLHTKRFRDVEQLLAAGIDVYTTLNVQHVESLNDVVAQITGVRVHETVPDAALDRANEIELVDLPAEELRKRLAEGKVYFPEQAERAAENFFREGNLIALRELALRRTAALPPRPRRARNMAHRRAGPRVCRAQPVRLASGAGRTPDGRAAAGGVDGGVRRDARPRSDCGRGSRAARKDSAAGGATRR
jgi:two-component system sensor histidine kinase KdpD